MASRLALLSAPVLAGAITAATLAGGVAWADGSRKVIDHTKQHSIAAVTPSIFGVKWDEAASRELEQELHRLHHIWNAGDIAGLREFIIGDDVLPTFELDPRSHKPITLSSKNDFDRFVSDIIAAQTDRKIVTLLDEPSVRCRATTSWGICTEECSVTYKHVDTGERIGVDKLRATQIAVRTPEGWRWLQWHMSNSRPPESTAHR